MSGDGTPGALPNADQAEYWNSASGRQWIASQEVLDQRFGPLTDLLIARAGVGRDACVVDVGCGTGATTLKLAAAVGAHGAVLAVDISDPLLAVARRRVMQSGHANVRFARSDAQTHRFEQGCYDLVISRFGVMFFDDPAGAFRNLSRALRPRGRLAFVCWGPLEHNPYFALPLEVGIERLGPPEARPPRAPGPMALSERDYIDEILNAAGLGAIEIAQNDIRLPGAHTAREEAELMSMIGPLARLIKERGADEAVRQDLMADLTDRLAPYLTADGIRLPATVHLVTATAPG